jgi:hypothetical protein
MTTIDQSDPKLTEKYKDYKISLLGDCGTVKNYRITDSDGNELDHHDLLINTFLTLQSLIEKTPDFKSLTDDVNSLKNEVKIIKNIENDINNVLGELKTA